MPLDIDSSIWEPANLVQVTINLLCNQPIGVFYMFAVQAPKDPTTHVVFIDAIEQGWLRMGLLHGTAYVEEALRTAPAKLKSLLQEVDDKILFGVGEDGQVGGCLYDAGEIVTVNGKELSLIDAAGRVSETAGLADLLRMADVGIQYHEQHPDRFGSIKWDFTQLCMASARINPVFLRETLCSLGQTAEILGRKVLLAREKTRGYALCPVYTALEPGA